MEAIVYVSLQLGLVDIFLETDLKDAIVFLRLPPGVGRGGGRGVVVYTYEERTGLLFGTP